MLHAALLSGECEEAATASGLVMSSVDRNTRIETIQQSADAAMADEEDVARLISSQNVFDLLDDARLGINRPLPAPDADLGLGKKLVGDRLKLFRNQETGCRSIILMHRLPNLYDDVQLGGNDFGCIDRLSLAARDDLRCASKLPPTPDRLRARSSELAQAPARDGDRRINIHFGIGEVAYEAHRRILTPPCRLRLVGPGQSTRPELLSIARRRNPKARGIEDVHVPSRSDERGSLARSRRLPAADFGHEQPIVGTAQIGERGLAEPLDQFDDAFHREGTICSATKMLGTDADRQPVADLE